MKIMPSLIKKTSIYISLLFIAVCTGCKTTSIQNEKPLEYTSIEDARKYFDRGMMYNKEKNRVQAISNFSLAIKLDPSLQRAYLYRGLTYHDIGRYSEAIQDFTKAILLEPQDITEYSLTYCFRGNSYYMTGEYNEAINDLTK